METMLGDVWNSIGDSWANWMWAMTWQAAVLLGIIWATTRLAFKSSASFRYCLWLLLFVKLLLPPTLSTPWSPANALTYMPELSFSAEQAQVPEQPGALATEQTPPVASATPAAPPSSPPFPEDASVEPSSQDADPAIAAVQETGMAPVIASPAISRASIVLTIWAMIALSMALFIILRYRAFKRAVLRDVEPVDDNVQALADGQAEKLGLRRAYRLYATPHLSIPAVFCLRKPVVLLPQRLLRTLPRKQLANVIGHELAHLKRRDIEVGWFVSLLICLYWFHPAVWLANLYLRREREMACDDKVLYATRQEGKEYAATIVRLVESFDKEVPAGAGFFGLIEVADNLLQRIRSAVDGARPRRAGRRSFATVVLLILLAMPMGVWTTSAPADAETSAIDNEIAEHYAKADADVQEYIRWTARTFSHSGLWQPAEAFDALSTDEREKKITYMVDALDSEYGRHLCSVLAEAGAIKDARLMPGLTKAASYHRDDNDYDCRPKWMAVSALGRQDDISAGPVLIPLVDHGNQNTRMWARASLVRLTGENFSDDKQAWGRWWNESGHEPKIDLAELKPWTMPGQTQTQETAAVANSTPPAQTAAVPADLEARVEQLPGTLEFKGTYIHKSRGGEYPEPSTVWIKRTDNNQLNAIAYLPSLGSIYFTHIESKDDNSVVLYEQGAAARDGRPAWKQILEFGPDTVGIKYEGGEKDGQVKSIPRPANSFFWPNTRPDPYLVPMGLFLKERGVGIGEPTELPLYDWDNTGEGFATYKVRWEYKAKESVTVPAGTFTAHHLTETQTTPSDTWYKKYQGLVTDYWILDSGVVVRILRNREPYELLLSAMAMGEPEQAAETAMDEPAAASAETTQPGTVYGNVLDATSGEPIANAFVAIDHSGDAGGSNLERFHNEGLYSTATTDSDGRFTLDNLALRDDHPFYVTAPGHTRHEQTVALSTEMNEVELVVKLDPSARLTVTTAEAPGPESTSILRLSALDGHLFYPPKADWPAWPYIIQTTQENTTTFGDLKLGGYRVLEVRLADASANTFVYAGAAEVDLQYGETEEVKIAPTTFDTYATLTIAPAPSQTDTGKFFFTLGPPIGNLPEPGTAVSSEGEVLGRIISNALLVNYVAGASYFEMSLDKPIELIGFPPGKYRAAVVRVEALPDSNGSALILRWIAFETTAGSPITIEIPWPEPILPSSPEG